MFLRGRCAFHNNHSREEVGDEICAICGYSKRFSLSTRSIVKSPISLINYLGAKILLGSKNVFLYLFKSRIRLMKWHSRLSKIQQSTIETIYTSPFLIITVIFCYLCDGLSSAPGIMVSTFSIMCSGLFPLVSLLQTCSLIFDKYDKVARKLIEEEDTSI